MLEPDTIIHKMDRAGIDKVILIPAMTDPLPETPDTLLAVFRMLMTSPLHSCAGWLNRAFMTAQGDLKFRGNIYRIYSLPDNAGVAEAIKAHPERFLGWIFLNPRAMEDPVEELEKWRQVPGFVGVKLHPHWHGYPIDEVFPIAARCEELSLPILIHLGFDQRGEWRRMTARYPRLRVIFAHAGMPHFARMWDHIKDNANVWVDVSSPYLSERLVRRAVLVLGPDRVMYGTDAPYGIHAHDHSYDYGAIKRWVERLPCRSADIDRMLGQNVDRLLGEAR